MSFCTAINCIDGRVQVPVIEYLTERLGVSYVDMVTEPGPVRALSDLFDTEVADSIFRRVQVSVDAHESSAIVLIAHADCAGNPVSAEKQKAQLDQSAKTVSERFPELPVLGLWLDESGVPVEHCGLPATSSGEVESWTDWEPPAK